MNRHGFNQWQRCRWFATLIIKNSSNTICISKNLYKKAISDFPRYTLNWWNFNIAGEFPNCVCSREKKGLRKEGDNSYCRLQTCFAIYTGVQNAGKCEARRWEFITLKLNKSENFSLLKYNRTDFSFEIIGDDSESETIKSFINYRIPDL